MPGQARCLRLSWGFPRPRPQLAPGSTAPGTSCCPGTVAQPGRAAKPGLKPWAKAMLAVQQGMRSLPGCSPRRARCRAWCRRAGRSGGTSRTRFPARRRPRLRAGGWTSPVGDTGMRCGRWWPPGRGPGLIPRTSGFPGRSLSSSRACPRPSQRIGAVSAVAGAMPGGGWGHRLPTSTPHAGVALSAA